MKKCTSCGCEIVNGVNGCSLLPVCFSCNGGLPKYPAPVVRGPFQDVNDDELNALEDRCLNDDYALE